MKRILVILMFIVTLMITVPVMAAKLEPVGEQIHIRIGPEIRYYPANTPFFIRHGWMSILDPKKPSDVAKFAKSRFELEIDGEPVEEDYVDIVRVAGDDPGTANIYQYFYFIFPEGLTGEHTFTGHWYIECKWMETPDMVCKDPNAIIEALTRSIEVTFY
jgi:hypothetical protein